MEGACKLAYGVHTFTAGQSLQCAADQLLRLYKQLADVLLIIFNDALHGTKCSPIMIV